MGTGSPSVVVSARGGQRQTIPWAQLSPKVSRTDSAVVFACTARINQTIAATFDYAIRVKENVVTIEMENIKETAGYDLNEFLFPADPLVRVSMDLPGASVCAGDLAHQARSPRPARS